MKWHPTKSSWLIALAAVTALAIGGCSDDDEHVHEAEVPATANISFDTYVGIPGSGGTIAEINELNLQYTTSFGASYSIATLQYIVSDVRLHMTNGETVGMDGIHYRDQGDDGTRTLKMGDVPTGTYDKISFTFGLDEYKNLRGKYAAMGAEFEADMAWPIAMGANMGYHYLKIEGNFIPSGDTVSKGYTTHTGARQCDGPCGPLGEVVDPAPHHHYFRVELPINEVTVGEGGRIDVTVNMDINGWYNDPDPGDGWNTNHDWQTLAMQMIMANLPEQEKIMFNGPSCFSADAEVK